VEALRGKISLNGDLQQQKRLNLGNLTLHPPLGSAQSTMNKVKKSYLFQVFFIIGLKLLLVQCSRFLQHCALRFALEYLEYTQKSTKINRRGFKKALRYFLSFIYS
jgi:hypothetical protein